MTTITREEILEDLAFEMLKKAHESGIKKKFTKEEGLLLLIDDKQYQELAQFVVSTTTKKSEISYILTNFTEKTRCKSDEKGRRVICVFEHITDVLIGLKEEAELEAALSILKQINKNKN